MAAAPPDDPLPLNHRPPPPVAEPPRKKQRSRNTKPKLSVDEVTAPPALQSALAIGRRFAARPPAPGREGDSLARLLRCMAAWAADVAPHYSLPEFVVAAQAIAGSRALRPVLADIRLAELREVNGDYRADGKQPRDPVKPEKTGDGLAAADAPVETGAVRAEVGPVTADDGPPPDDVWEEPDVFPDEDIGGPSAAMPPQPPSSAPMAPSRNGEAKQKEELSPEVLKRIEKSRLAALERKKKTLARLAAQNAPASRNDASSGSAAPEAPASPNVNSAAVEKESDREALSISRKSQHHLTETQRPQGDATVQDGTGGSFLSQDGADIAAQRDSDGALPDASAAQKTSSVGNVPQERAAENVSEKGRQIDETADNRGPSATSSAPEEPLESRNQDNVDSETCGGKHSAKESSTATGEGVGANVTEDKPKGREDAERKTKSPGKEDEDIDLDILAEFEAGDET